jgi:hypothetical protein
MEGPGGNPALYFFELNSFLFPRMASPKDALALLDREAVRLAPADERQRQLLKRLRLS